MADTITVTYKVNEDGSLQKIAKKAGQAAKATDDAAKAGRGYSKVQKGVAQTGLSSAKSFSKMSQSIEGGLVPAYATLAAHVFAVTAAFGILSRSQAVKQLNEGLLFTGRAAGENLTIVTKNLREITDNAVSSADAMRALAVGVSAGFSEDQMEGLTKVAKGASLALGRDMTDALDRLVRGAAKLEPEILDELGIMVRLDDATEKYAASIGVAADELTQFERRMAFTNAVIEQGESKFGALAASVASNPFNQLAATFDDMVKAGMNFINLVAGPIAGFLAGSMAALIATMAVLGTGVVNMMVPALTKAGEASADLAKQMSNSAKATIAHTKATKTSPKVFKELSVKMAKGTATAKDLTDAQTSLTKSVALHKKQLPGMIAAHGAESAAIQKKKLVIQQNEMALHQLTSAQAMETLATQKAAQADILAAASAGKLKLTIQLLRAEIARESLTVTLATAGKGFLAGAYARVAMSAGIAAISVRVFGLALLQSIPIIGQVILAGLLLWQGFKWLFGSDAEETVSPLADVLEEGKERFAEFPNIIRQMAESYEMASTASERYLISLKAQNGLMKQTLTHVRDLRIAESVNQGMDLAAAQRKIAAAKKTEADARVLLDKAGVSNTEGEEIGFFATALEYLAGHGVREGVSSEDRVGAITSINQALEDQARLTGQIAQLEAAAAGPSEERLLVTEKAYRTLSLTLQSQRNAVEKGSEEFDLLSKNIAEVDTILSTLSAETIDTAEASLASLSREVTKTEASFQSLKDAGAEVEAFFAKNKAITGEFSDQIKLLDKGLASIVRTIGSDIQDEKLNEAFEKFGVSNEKELQALRDRFNLANESLKEEAKLLAILGASKDRLNNAGLKDKALEVDKAQILIQQLNVAEQLELATLSGLERHALEQKQLQLLSKEEKNRLDTIKERLSEQTRLGGDSFGAAMSAGSYMQENQAEFDSAATSDKIKMLGIAMQPMMDNLKSLGPEGELVSAIAQGAFVASEAWTAAFENMGDGPMKLEDGLMAAAATVNALSGIISASSKANIANVDGEIEAEKRRDGQSAASLAKIKSLEKKKEQMARKAFEVNKKMQMASAVVNTAAAVVGMLAATPQGLWNIPLAAMMGGLGAAQLAIISGTSFQGGGAASSAPSAPSALTMGERSNTVDLAKGNNAGGELAYMRGAQGQGQATNFKPTSAFSGYKNRAAGGYIVGEQGPEVFMPDVPGEIIASGKGTGAPTNVSFNIQAVDAAGVEEVLIAQKGHIIRMIREAANEHGEFFLEGVSDEAYSA